MLEKKYYVELEHFDNDIKREYTQLYVLILF